ncbi:hypothetical protein R6Z02_14525 [Carnobacterium maltaromaticum]|uniref:hypothetical protein n=1 Tax=Carnobacterium maltaromaticum TaxID=2751 RepID=UPI0012FAF815|nr:hypothetical protein [Carnobacterium maltaromaticum]MDW5524971.1 hypothetical protein [Carnobacterium maltaromaticum]CAD5903205.1 hypothetical protein CMALT394_660013 [Carnobacterium maltaromaticum]
MDNFQKAAILFSELKKEVKINNKEDRVYLEVLKLALDKIDQKEKLISEEIR